MYCQKLCDFHRETIASGGRMGDSPNVGQVPPPNGRREESVQAGASSVFPGADHYLFDPSGDILYNAWSASGGGLSSRGSKDTFIIADIIWLDS